MMLDHIPPCVALTYSSPTAQGTLMVVVSRLLVIHLSIFKKQRFYIRLTSTSPEMPDSTPSTATVPWRLVLINTRVGFSTLEADKSVNSIEEQTSTVKLYLQIN